MLFGQISFGQNKFTKEKIVGVAFDWANPDSKDVMLVTAKLDTLDYFFHWQLDTGSPYTYLEGGTFKKFTNKFPYLAGEIKRADTAYNGNWYKIFTPPFKFEVPVLPNVILKNDKIRGAFSQDLLDKYKGFSIGTIGVDIFKNKVLILDFKNKKVGYCDRLTKNFYKQKINFPPFQFYKNRIILPVQIGTEKCNFIYDGGASMFTLNVTPKHSKSFAPKQLTNTLYNVNNGESGTIYNALGSKTYKRVTLLGKTYKNMIVYVEKSESEIFEEAKVTGAVTSFFLTISLLLTLRKKNLASWSKPAGDRNSDKN